jgi:hypothetical protein
MLNNGYDVVMNRQLVNNSSSSITLMLRCLVILILTSLFTILCVRESRVIGRLSTSPNYDDCTYSLSGAVLLGDLKADGVLGFAEYLKKQAPCGGFHSPYSVLLATASYAVFGINEAAPYYGNALVVLVYLCGVGWMLRSLPALPWMLGLILFLSSPLITMGVVEFRPDVAWGIVVGFGVVLIVTSEKLFRSQRHAFLAGLPLGLALVIKPSTFVMTLLLFGGAITSRIIGAFLEKRLKPERTVALGIFAFLVGALIVAAPYWIFYGKEILSYFLDNAFGVNKSVWIYHGSRHDFLFYYLTGDGWRSAMWFPGTAIGILGIACMIYLSGRRPDLRWKLTSLILLMLGGLAVNSVAQIKSVFLASGLYGTLFFSASYLLATAWVSFAAGKESRTVTRIKIGILILLTGTACLFYRWPDDSNWGSDPANSANLKNARDFMEATLKGHPDDFPKSILFMQSGPIISETTGIYLESVHRRALIASGAFYRGIDEFRQHFPWSDWIVIPEQGVMGARLNMPSEQLLTECLAILNNDSNFHQIAEFTAANGKKVWIYSKVKKQLNGAQ